MCHASLMELSVMKKSKLYICKRFNTYFPSSVADSHFDCLSTTGMTEPAYKEQEFVTPTKARRILIRNWFESKYRNMWWLSCSFIIMLCRVFSVHVKVFQTDQNKNYFSIVTYLKYSMIHIQIKLISSTKELQMFSVLFYEWIFAYGN